MPRETKRRDGDGSGPDRGSERAAIAAQVEGPYANGKLPPPDNSAVYPSHAQAEQVVSIVGIKNAQAGYFGGQTKLMGAA